MDIQESSREDNSKFNFLGVIGRAKGLGECIFQTFNELKIQNFGNQGATFRVYWVITNLPFWATQGLECMIGSGHWETLLKFCNLHAKYLQYWVNLWDRIWYINFSIYIPLCIYIIVCSWILYFQIPFFLHVHSNVIWIFIIF